MNRKIISDFSGGDEPYDYYFYDKTAIPIYRINSFHSLTQFVGYAKYINRQNGNVYLRGQNSLYEDKITDLYGTLKVRLLNSKLTPSAFRREYSSVHRAVNQIKHQIGRLATEDTALCDMEEERLWPLLQHYGIKTNWLDIIDNIWVALWFGLHEFSSIVIDRRELMHITQRKHGSVYVILLLSDAVCEEPGKPGVYVGKNTILNDLRKSLPSYYLRPHAQHALMIRKKIKNKSFDYSDLIVGIASFAVETAIDWIGRSGLLSVQSLLPSAYFDLGYRDLLEYMKIPPTAPTNFIDCYGSIQYITSDFF